jgi:hypothetical protein
MSGVIPLIPLNAIMMSTWTTDNETALVLGTCQTSQISGSSMTNVDIICNYFSKTCNYKQTGVTSEEA